MYKFQYNNISSARLYIRTFAEQSFISQKLNSTESAFTKLEEALTSIQSNTNFPCVKVKLGSGMCSVYRFEFYCYTQFGISFYLCTQGQSEYHKFTLISFLTLFCEYYIFMFKYEE